MTAGPQYAERLERLSAPGWKRLLDVQRPYRWNLRRLKLGRTIDVGCGLGRNLEHLDVASVGIDHNSQCVDNARARGLTAYTPEEFVRLACSEPFDSMLVAHVLEHLDRSSANELVRTYLPCVKRNGAVVFITPQEAGFVSDDTHVRFVDFCELRDHADELGLSIERLYSFPFSRSIGKLFTYNEFVAVCRKH